MKILQVIPYDCPTKYTVADGIEEIAASAAAGRRTVEQVVLPDGLLKIGDFSFGSCSNLKKINFPKSLISIGCAAFKFTALQEAVLPNEVTRIEGETFGGCSDLRSVTLSDKTEYIGRETFKGCRSLKRIYIPKSVREIGADAFDDCGSDLEIFFEGDDSCGFVGELRYQETESIVTPEDDAFNFHRSSGGWTSHTVTVDRVRIASWNPKNYKVHTFVTKKEYSRKQA